MVVLTLSSLLITFPAICQQQNDTLKTDNKSEPWSISILFGIHSSNITPILNRGNTQIEGIEYNDIGFKGVAELHYNPRNSSWNKNTPKKLPGSIGLFKARVEFMSFPFLKNKNIQSLLEKNT
ncbi:MAG: hypothetical protein ABEH43_10280, partial [Flavobacteriales bacterium]